MGGSTRLGMEMDSRFAVTLTNCSFTQVTASDQVTAKGGAFLGIGITEADNVVYILDRSGGMVSTWRTLCGQVKKSVNTLTPKQSFAIIMCGTYDNLTMKSGYSPAFIVGAKSFLIADKKNKENVYA